MELLTVFGGIALLLIVSRLRIQERERRPGIAAPAGKRHGRRQLVVYRRRGSDCSADMGGCDGGGGDGGGGGD